MTWLADTQRSYDTVADSYAEFVSAPLDPQMQAALSVFAARVDGPVADVGCGPGQITARLRDLGVSAFGVDLSPGMIAVARRDHPDLRFLVGSMTSLPVATASLGGLLAWWSLIHVPDSLVPSVLAHFHRVLRPGGLLQLGFHVGSLTRLKTEGYGGHPMKVHIHRRQPDQVAAWLREAGFEMEAQWLMDPDAPVPGAILFARRPRAAGFPQAPSYPQIRPQPVSTPCTR